MFLNFDQLFVYAFLSLFVYPTFMSGCRRHPNQWVYKKRANCENVSLEFLIKVQQVYCFFTWKVEKFFCLHDNGKNGIENS